MIRVGFIGCGGVAREYLGRLDALPGVALVAACDLDSERAGSLAAGRDARVYADYREMLELEVLDAVFDNLPPFARGDEIVLAAQKGCAVFTTKPLGLELGVARKSLAAIEAAGVVNAAGYMFRYSGITEYARNLLAERPAALVLGRVFGGMPGGWVGRRALSGGQLVEQSTHLFDLVRHLAGEIAQVHAVGSAGHVPDRVDYEDSTTVNLRFASGAVGAVASSCAPWQFFWGLSLVGRDFHLELVYDEWTVRGRVDGREVHHFDPKSGYPEQVAAFLEAVRTGDQSLVRCSYRDGLGTLAATLAANRSLQSGRPEVVAL